MPSRLQKMSLNPAASIQQLFHLSPGSISSLESGNMESELVFRHVLLECWIRQPSNEFDNGPMPAIGGLESAGDRCCVSSGNSSPTLYPSVHTQTTFAVRW
jgi:hypothetical protein